MFPAEHVLLASASMPRSLRAQKHIQGHLKITGMSLMQLNIAILKPLHNIQTTQINSRFTYCCFPFNKAKSTRGTKRELNLIEEN